MEKREISRRARRAIMVLALGLCVAVGCGKNKSVPQGAGSGSAGSAAGPSAGSSVGSATGSPVGLGSAVAIAVDDPPATAEAVAFLVDACAAAGIATPACTCAANEARTMLGAKLVAKLQQAPNDDETKIATYYAPEELQRTMTWITDAGKKCGIEEVP
jgi:hypothetical protein